MIIKRIGDLSIWESTTGGSAGKRSNKTQSIQVRQDAGQGYLLLAQYRFKTGDLESRDKAIKKAELYIQKQ